VLKSAHLA